MIVVLGNLAAWGYIPNFLDEDDPRPAAEQFHANYVSGWSSFKRFKFNKDTLTLTYPGDPPTRAISAMGFRNEIIYLFESSWVVIVQPDGTWDVSRMD